MNKISLLILFILSFSQIHAEGNLMEEYMYSSGKIWVAITVIMLILLLIFAYLWRMDRKLDRMEKEAK